MRTLYSIKKLRENDNLCVSFGRKENEFGNMHNQEGMRSIGF
jgi:hypothetical protein